MGGRLAAIILLLAAFPAQAGEHMTQQRPPQQSQAAQQQRLEEIDAKFRAITEKLAEHERAEQRAVAVGSSMK